MVKEKHGVIVNDGAAAAIINEKTGHITLVISKSNGSSLSMNITPEEARYLASKLRRVAKRVEEDG